MQNTIPHPTATDVETVDSTDAYELAERRLMAAYSDRHSHHVSGYIPERNLHFCCPVTVRLSEAIRLLRRYVPGYNAFSPALLKALPPRCRVRLAREGSVCLYVETRGPLDEKALRRIMRCAELDLCAQVGKTYIYRIYWD